MLLAMTGGVILSVPFAPPVDAHSMRIYAATIPLCALLVAHGAALLMPRSVDSASRGRVNAVAVASGILLVFVALFGSIALRLSREPVHLQSPPCPPGQASLFVRLGGGSSIRLVEDDALAQSRVPNIRISDFKTGLSVYRKEYPLLYGELENLKAGQAFRSTINLARNHYGEPLWLISDAEMTPGTGLVHACAVLTGNKAGRFYYARTLQVVSGNGL
jgi:hypothetical protein